MTKMRWSRVFGVTIGALVFVVNATPAAATADDVRRWRSLIEDAADRFGMPAAWIERVMRAESGGRTRANGHPIRSRAGAIGLMQLMPATWTEMRARLALGPDPDAPRDNILAGALYLRLMYERFGYPGLFAAYNAGPARYARFLGGHALPRETLAYVATVTRDDGPHALARTREQPLPSVALFYTIRQTPSPVIGMPTGSQSELFAINRGTAR